MFENIRNVITNRKFQFGFGSFAVLALVGWFFTNNQETETVVTEEASTATTTVEMTKHDQTPTIQSQEETVQEEVDVNEEVVVNKEDN